MPAAAQQITEQEGLVPDTCEASGIPVHSAKSGSQQGTKQENAPATAAPGAAGRMVAQAREASSKEALTEEGAKPSPEWLEETQQPAAPVRPFTRAKYRSAAAASADRPPAVVPGNDKVAEQEPPAKAGPASQKGLAGRRGTARLKRAGAEGGPGSSEKDPAAAEPVCAGSSRRAEEQGAGRSGCGKRPCRQGRSRAAEDRSFIQQFTAQAGGLPGAALSKSPEAVDEPRHEAGEPCDAENAPPVQPSSDTRATPAEGAQAMPEGDRTRGPQPIDTLHPSQSQLSAGEQLHHKKPLL